MRAGIATSLALLAMTVFIQGGSAAGGRCETRNGFRGPVKIGHTVGAAVEITDLNLPRKSATLHRGSMAKENVVIDGKALVPAPTGH